MLGWNVVKQAIGLFLIFLSLADPFSWGNDFKIVAFIIGFDAMALLPRIIIFGIDFLWDISGFGLLLILAIIEDIAFHLFSVGAILQTMIRPAVVFFIVFVNGYGFWIAILAAAIDLVLNFQRKLV